MILVNSNTRHFNIPGADLVFGVTDDSDVERKYFQCPRYVGDNLDLAACFIRINFRTANGKMDSYLVDDLAIDGDNITFSWLLSPKVTEYRGQVKFVMCAVGPDLKLKWHTAQGTGQVLEGLEPDNSHVESQTADVVAQLISMVEEQTSAVEKVGEEQVASVRSATETARTSAVNEIEAKRANSLASIPNDYTALNNTVESLARVKGGAIVCEVEGTAVAVDDSSDMPIQGMRIFGRSTQDGIPTPDAPVEIVSIESPTVRACGKNLVNVPDFDSTSYSISAIWGEDAAVLPVGVPIVVNYDYVGNGTPSASTNYTVGIAYENATSVVYKRKGEPFAPEAKVLRITIYGDTTGSATEGRFSNISVRLASAEETFEPYKTRQSIQITRPLRGIPVTSGGNYTDANGQQWICDEVDLERGVYVQRVSEIVLDGTQTYHINVYQQNQGFYVFGCSRYGASYSEAPMLCDRLIFKPWGYWNMVTGSNFVCYESSAFYVYLQDQSITTVDAFKKYLENNPITIKYILATPIETPLTEAEIAAYRTLHSNYPNTTVLNDAGAHMVVKYAADTKLYIDKKIKEALQ